MMITDEVRRLLRECRFSLIRFEDDDDEEALESLYDAQNILSDIAVIVDPPEDVLDTDIPSA